MTMMGGRNTIHDVPLGAPHAANDAYEPSVARARAAKLTKTRNWMKKGGELQRKKPAHDRRTRREVYGDNFSWDKRFRNNTK